MDHFIRNLVLKSKSHIELPGNIFLGDLPERLELFILEGSSNNFTSLKFVKGASPEAGTLIIGGKDPNNSLQFIDLESLSVTGTVALPSTNSTDVSD